MPISSPAGSVPAGAPRPTCPRVTTADGRSPGSRVSALRRLPRNPERSPVAYWRAARRLQLRGQPQLRHYCLTAFPFDPRREPSRRLCAEGNLRVNSLVLAFQRTDACLRKQLRSLLVLASPGSRAPCPLFLAETCQQLGRRTQPIFSLDELGHGLTQRVGHPGRHRRRLIETNCRNPRNSAVFADVSRTGASGKLAEREGFEEMWVYVNKMQMKAREIVAWNVRQLRVRQGMSSETLRPAPA
jgi:hypothetical protein